MSDWSVELELVDGKSKKFWRARTEGGSLVVNFGRIGTDGQNKTKDLGDAGAAEAELDKLAASKRKKGYADVAGAAKATPAPVAKPVVVPDAKDDAPTGPVTLTYTAGGRQMKLTMKVVGKALETELSETYPDEAAANKALARIQQALSEEGYR